MTSLAIVYAALVAAMIVFAATSWALARLVGARVTSIALGAPSVTIRRREPAIRLGLIPNGAVELYGRAPDTDDSDPRSWKRLGLGRRLLVLAGPWLITLGVAAACLGPARALRSFGRGVEQLLLVVDLAPLVRAFVDWIAAAPLAAVAGVVFAKLTAANTVFVLGGVLQELASPRWPGWLRAYQLASFLFVFLWIGGRLAWALIRVAL